MSEDWGGDMKRPIKRISAETFSKYGGVLGEQGAAAGFEVFFDEDEKVGWRLAVSTFENTTIEKLARHPNTVESFSPLQGISLLCVSNSEVPEEVAAFLLDRPIFLHKNIWHGTLALSEQAVLSICENSYVESEEYELENPFEVSVTGGV
ncbi:ureidoglycolate hydrolase [Planomicrobium soli]|uniref:Ureidoglycolate hydrolase n=1 Tax=Planomicrobium soli TaxID=1176648 RepID=A0A2P8H3D2_9BACL|nr:ureidoglycolate lyase [Planomicrobium soli]PSL40726.1 ureidoglycolate hydrolase [Planomicrobium soli]